MAKPYLATLNDGEDNLTLLIRLPGDRDYFVWGPVTLEQLFGLEYIGAMDLDDGYPQSIVTEKRAG